MNTMGAAGPSAAETAAKYGLERAGARPPLIDYIRQLWDRRDFIVTYSTMRRAAGNTGSYLGQWWNLLTPLLNAAVYYLIFGELLKTNRGIDNYIAFLVIGVFTFAFCNSSVTGGSNSITSNLGLLRSLHFPRAILPISTILVNLQQLIYSLVIILPIVLLTGEGITVQWLTLVPAIFCQTVFCMGLGLLFARIGAHLPDATNLLPHLTRIWMYLSGIMYSIDHFTKGHPAWIKTVLQVNPGAVYVQLARAALLKETSTSVHTWVLAIGWAVAAFVIGFILFWRGEEEYGRV